MTPFGDSSTIDVKTTRRTGSLLDFQLFTPKPGEWPNTPDTMLLRLLDWNDWFRWRTSFYAYYVDLAGTRHDIGGVKIGKLDHEYLNDAAHATPLRPSFKRLSDSYVSLGQDESYYSTLRDLLGEVKLKRVLKALGDLAVDPDRFTKVRQDEVVDRSLLRSVSPVTVAGTYSRIIDTGVGAASFDFAFHRPSRNPLEENAPLNLEFSVTPGSTPPTNVHVLIGRNGSGKTSILRSMVRSMLGEPIATEGDGWFDSVIDSGRLNVANLVYVAFSAFDDADLPVRDSGRDYAVPYAYVGLQYADQPYEGEPVTSVDIYGDVKRTRPPSALADVFADSAWAIARERSLGLWGEALRTLESDPNFAEADVSALSEIDMEQELDARAFKNEASALYGKLSSGHKIVLLTMTRLVQSVTERTMVLLDEPEGHLHPPLLSAFTRALSTLMQRRNGVAIIATHSPVILQEVPQRCVYSVRRVGDSQVATRPDRETFGENVGALTNSVFSLEVMDSGFRKMLVDAAIELQSYGAVVDRFDNELGLEARGTLRSWFASRSKSTADAG